MACIVTHPAFRHSRLGTDMPASTRENGPIFNTDDAAGDFQRRLRNAGCRESLVFTLSDAEYRALVLARLPQTRR